MAWAICRRACEPGKVVVGMARVIGGAILLVAVGPFFSGCAHGPRSFRKVDNPSPLVRARAVGLGGTVRRIRGSCRPWSNDCRIPTRWCAGCPRRAAQADRARFRVCPVGKPGGAHRRDRALEGVCGCSEKESRPAPLASGSRRSAIQSTTRRQRAGTAILRPWQRWPPRQGVYDQASAGRWIGNSCLFACSGPGRACPSKGSP